MEQAARELWALVARLAQWVRRGSRVRREEPALQELLERLALVEGVEELEQQARSARPEQQAEQEELERLVALEARVRVGRPEE